MNRRHAEKLRSMIVKGSVSLPDEDALEAIELYDAWQNDTAYQAGDRRRYEGVLYKCIQAHKSQADWAPDITPALWAVVSIEEWPEWVQPAGSHDAYNAGDKVSHNGSHWISDIDANTYEPGVYGWTEEND